MKYHALKINSEKYKWVIAFMCMLVLCIGLGFCSTAKSIFIAPITEAFGFTRSAYSVNDTLRYVTVSVVTMFFYILVQKFGTKKLMIIGMVFYIISTILNAFSTTLIGFYIAGIFLGLGVSLSSTTMASLIINTWFDKHQGAVLGVVMASNAVGSAVAVNILTPIIYKDGNPFAFRNAYLLTAILLLVTTLIFAIFYKGKEKTIHKQDTQNKKELIKDTSDGFEFKEIIKLPEFYIITLCMFFFFLTSIGNVVTPHFTDIGFEPSFVASTLSILSVGLALSKILVGVIYDRFGIRTALNVCLVSSVVAKFLLFVISASPTGKVLAILHSLLNALGTTVETVMLPIVATALFGGKSFVKTLSFITVAGNVGHSLCAPLLNLPYDISGDYTLSFVFSFAFSVAIFIAMNVVITTLKNKKTLEVL